MDTYPINLQNPVELNRYGYTANNPVNAVDPSGLVMVARTATSSLIVSGTIVGIQKTATEVFVIKAALTIILFAKAERKQFRKVVNKVNADHGCNIDPNKFREWFHRKYKKDVNAPRGYTFSEEDLYDIVLEYIDEVGCD